MATPPPAGGRRTRSRAARVAAAFALASCVRPASAPRAAAAASAPPGAADCAFLQPMLDSLHAAGRFPGATLGVAWPDGRACALATGQSDTTRRAPMRPTDLLLSGSVGKTYVAAVAMQLVAEGRLRLDARVAAYLGQEPWFARLPNAADITVRQLMNHTSGLVRYEFGDRFLRDLAADPDRVWTPEARLAYLFDTRAPFAAGAGWDYSDTNYIVLGMILERLTGQPLFEAVRRRVTAPLGLARTVPSDRRVVPGLVQGYAGPRNMFGGADAMVLPDGRFAINPQFEWAGGGMASTADDLARWTKLRFEGRAYPDSLQRQVLDGRDATAALGPGVRYGLATIIRPSPLGVTYGHSGYMPGYVTDARYWPEHRVAVALQLNTSVGGALGRPTGAVLAEVARRVVAQGVGQRVAQSAPPAGPTGTLVVSNMNDHTVTVLDAATGRVRATLPAGRGPHEVAVSRDGRWALVSNYGERGAPGNSLTVVDVARAMVARTLALGGFARPHGLAFLPGDTLAAVTAETARAVLVVDVRDGRVVDTLSTGGRGSHMVAVPARGDRAFTGNIADATVSALDLRPATMRRAARLIPVARAPEAIAVTPDGRQLWVGSNRDSVVLVVDVARGAAVDTLRGFGMSYRIAVTPDGRTAVVTDPVRAEVRVVDVATRRTRHTVAVPADSLVPTAEVPGSPSPEGVALSRDGRWAFVTLQGRNRVATIDLARGAITAYAPTGTWSDGIGYSPLPAFGAATRPAPVPTPSLRSADAAPDAHPDGVRLAADVLVRRVAPGLWLHETLGPGAYPSNGLLLETADGGSVLFDTGWTDAQTERLLRWAADSLRRPVRRAVVTHAHVDRVGGLGALRARGVPAAGLALGAARARRAGLLPPGVPAPDSVPALAAGPVRDAAGFELFFPGAGHAPDNVVAYFPRQRVLFGGCLVKADTATTVGNVADADVANWPRAVARVRAAYPDARLVVPGHGAPGGPGALAWTERLIVEKGPSAKRAAGG